LLPALLAAELVTWGFVLLHDRRRVANKWRSYAWIACHLGEVLAGRRRTQALRRVRDRDLIAGCTYRLAYAQTASGPLARIVHAVFDPLFFVLQRGALALIRW
jgi:hypothetical protein